VTVAKTVGVSSGAVIIISITATQSARRCIISYNIVSTSTFDGIGKAVNSAISSGSFSDDLQSNTGIKVTALTTATIIDVSPTSMPSFMPSTIPESVSSLRLGITPIILIAVLGFAAVLSVLITIYYCSLRKSSAVHTKYEVPDDLLE
jgi:hypothetical protein